MSALRRRTVTAVVYGIVVVASGLAPPLAFAALVVVMAAIAAGELMALRGAGRRVLLQAALVVLGGVSLIGLRVLGEVSITALPAGRELVRGLGLVSPEQLPTPLRNVPSWLLLAVFATWAADIGAYLVGSAVGRHRIAPRISPGKTWEGTVGGFLIGAAATIALAGTLGLPPVAGAVAVGIGPLAFAGDLLESWVKRGAGVKDSGRLLPGHGGMLDRVDSLLATAPLVFLVKMLPCCAPTLG